MPKKKSRAVVARAYRDVLSPAAQEVGSTLAGAVRVALSPANLVIRTMDEALALAEEKVQERFRKWRVKPEAIRSPSPEVAAPALQALRFANQDPRLREMYLNLLARSMNAETSAAAHPAFADILRQLSPTDARGLSMLTATEPAIPLVEVRMLAEFGPGWQTVAKHINPLGSKLMPQVAVRRDTIENFVRVGVLAIHEGLTVSGDALYRELERSASAQNAVREIANQGRSFAFHRYMAEITAFGAQFLAAVGGDESGVEPGTT